MDFRILFHLVFIPYAIQGQQEAPTHIAGYTSLISGYQQHIKTGTNVETLGLVDITAAPYNADPYGKRDSTHAIQSAIEGAHKRLFGVFFPPGVYLISDTLNISAVWLGGKPESFYKATYKPNFVIGSRSTPHRPTLFLKSNSPGFQDVNNPKYVVHIWTDHDGHWQPNANIDQTFVGINVVIEQNNVGAIAIRHRCAQGSTVQDVDIHMADALIGLQGGAGSGAMHGNIAIYGGKFGLDYREAQPGPTITGLTLMNQTCISLLYHGIQTLVVVGAEILSHGMPVYVADFVGEQNKPFTPPKISPMSCTPPAPSYNPQLESAAVGGQLSLIDVVLQSGSKEQDCVHTNRGLYLRNVYSNRCTNVISFQGSTTSGGQLIPPLTVTDSSSWYQIEELAQPVLPPLFKRGKYSWQYKAPLYSTPTDRSESKSLRKYQRIPDVPPIGIVRKHLWDASSFPSFESHNAVNIKDAPYNAKGDGITDDWLPIQTALHQNDIVFLPKGAYRVSRTVHVPPGKSLVGLSKHYCALIPMSIGLADGDTYVVAVAGGHNADRMQDKVIISSISVVVFEHQNNTHGVLWQTKHPQSIFREVHIYRHTECTWGLLQPAVPCTPNVTLPGPLAKMDGASGMIFGFYAMCGYRVPQSPKYRSLLVTNSTNLQFYHLNTEHARGDAQTEVVDSINVSVYGGKSEGNYAVFWVHNSRNISWYGYAGYACPFPSNMSYPKGYKQYPPSLFRAENSSNVRFANLQDSGALPSGPQRRKAFTGQGFDPHYWNMIVYCPTAKPTPKTGDPFVCDNYFVSDPLDRPVLYHIS